MWQDIGSGLFFLLGCIYSSFHLSVSISEAMRKPSGQTRELVLSVADGLAEGEILVSSPM